MQCAFCQHLGHQRGVVSHFFLNRLLTRVGSKSDGQTGVSSSILSDGHACMVSPRAAAPRAHSRYRPRRSTATGRPGHHRVRVALASSCMEHGHRTGWWARCRTCVRRTVRCLQPIRRRTSSRAALATAHASRSTSYTPGSSITPDGAAN